jgi:hypothetical protein
VTSTLGPEDDLPSGSARSTKELCDWLVYEALCRKCGTRGVLVQSITPTSGRADVAARVTASCTKCGRLNRYSFTAGSSWGEEPPKGDPRLATSEAPSQLLPATLFERWIGEASTELARPGPIKHVWLVDAAKTGLRGVDELRKVRRASGTDLTPDQLRAASTFADAWISSGGTLPEALAWTRQPC